MTIQRMEHVSVVVDDLEGTGSVTTRDTSRSAQAVSMGVDVNLSTPVPTQVSTP